MTEYIYGTDEHGGHWLTDTEIVRCRDCVVLVPEHEYMTVTGDKYIVPDTCKKIRSYIQQIEPDGFCAWGERKVVD